MRLYVLANIASIRSDLIPRFLDAVIKLALLCDSANAIIEHAQKVLAADMSLDRLDNLIMQFDDVYYEFLAYHWEENRNLHSEVARVGNMIRDELPKGKRGVYIAVDDVTRQLQQIFGNTGSRDIHGGQVGEFISQANTFRDYCHGVMTDSVLEGKTKSLWSNGQDLITKLNSIMDGLRAIIGFLRGDFDLEDDPLGLEELDL